jgi:hypothetical protein
MFGRRLRGDHKPVYQKRWQVCRVIYLNDLQRLNAFSATVSFVLSPGALSAS